MISLTSYRIIPFCRTPGVRAVMYQIGARPRSICGKNIYPTVMSVCLVGATPTSANTVEPLWSDHGQCQAIMVVQEGWCKGVDQEEVVGGGWWGPTRHVGHLSKCG